MEVKIHILLSEIGARRQNATKKCKCFKLTKLGTKCRLTCKLSGNWLKIQDINTKYKVALQTTNDIES